jgi:hypothetical protein
LNFPYLRKNKKGQLPLEKMNKHDRFFLENFNFYNKNIDFSKIETSNEAKIIFKVERDANVVSTEEEDSIHLSNEKTDVNIPFRNAEVVDTNRPPIVSTDYSHFYNNSSYNTLFGMNYVLAAQLNQNLEAIESINQWISKLSGK